MRMDGPDGITRKSTIDMLNADNSGSKFRAVIFDLDGTLLDTLEDLATAANFVLRGKGYPEHSSAEYRYLVGDGVAVLFERALPAAFRTSAIITECVAAMRVAYAKQWNVHSRPYAGIPELLDGLIQRGLKLTVLSNKQHDFAGQCVRELMPQWSFDIVLGQRDNIPRKPDPFGVQEIIDRLGLSRPQVLYVGDTNVDMQTACNAGVCAVGAAWGFRPVDELLENGAQHIIHHPAELLAIVDGR